MKDGIIKGTGDSRNLKAAIPADITHEQLVAMLIAGTLPIDLNGINPEGWQQLGIPLNKSTLLSDVVAQFLGLSEDQATPNNAFLSFLKFLIPEGKYAFGITVKCEGIPIEGASLSGLTNTQGQEAVTNQDGFAFGYTDTTTLNLKVSNFADLQVFSGVFKKDSNIVTSVEVNLVRSVAKEIKITSSRSVRVSNFVSTYDLFAVGGGGSGGSYRRRSGSQPTAGGGAGGETATLLNITPKALETLSFVIGSGGGRVESNYGIDGKAGGRTSVTSSVSGTLLTASGGTGGEGSGYISDGGNGGSGGGGAKYGDGAGRGGSNGSSGGSTYGGSGQGRTTRKWGESNGELFSGAGGGASYSGSPKAGSGGAGGGGDGQYSEYTSDGNAESGSTYGAGGGAIVSNHDATDVYSGSGYRGVAFIRWRFKS